MTLRISGDGFEVEVKGPPEFTSLRAALSYALAETPHLPRDLATIALARHLAERVDQLTDRIIEAEANEGPFAQLQGLQDKLIGRYIATLDRMGMTPAARASTSGGESPGPPDPSAVALAHLQRGAEPGSAAVGVDYAAAVDPAVTASLTDD